MVKKEVKKFGNSNHIILSKKEFKVGKIVEVTHSDSSKDLTELEIKKLKEMVK